MSLHPHNTRTTTAATSELQTLTKLQTLNGGEEEESYEKKKKLNGEEEAQRQRRREQVAYSETLDLYWNCPKIASCPQRPGHLYIIQHFWTEGALFSSISQIQDLLIESINICIFKFFLHAIYYF